MEITQKLLFKFLAISFVLGLILFLIYGYNLDKGYEFLSDTDTLNSVVIQQEEHRGVSRIRLQTGQKFILPFARNDNYQIYDLHTTVREGDLILKKPGSDTIFVKRYSDTYIFVINKVIERK
jgi:hypothetical protein